MKRVVCILSSNYSGSHYLSLLLGSNSRAIHLGEVKNYVKDEPRACFACGEVDSCELFTGIASVPKREIYSLLFDRAGEGVECLVDNSKKPYWFEEMVNLPGIELKVIHLVRDPRALVRRWRLTYATRKLELQQRWRQFRWWHGKPEILFSRSMLSTYIHKWIWQNRDIRQFISKYNLDHRTLLYRDLAQAPAQTLAPVVSWLGLTFEPEQIEYWNFPHHGTQKEEYEWVKTQGVTGYVDLRWQEFLEDEELHTITSHELLAGFMRSVEVEFGDDGLYRLDQRRTSDTPA